MRKLAFAPLPDKIVCEPRAKTGVCVLYNVEKPAFALSAQYTIYTLLIKI